MDNLNFGEFVVSSAWIFAKTMPDNPHWYTLRKDANVHSSSFNNAVEYIRNHGETRLFCGRKYIEFDYDGYTYWTMGSPVEETILINRAKKNANNNQSV
jgi:hypothetical protein